MISRKTKYRQLEQALEVCKEFDDWYNRYNEPNSVKARLALTEFFKEYLKTKPDKQLDLGCIRDYYSFYANVMRLRDAFEAHNYPRACNELISLCFYEPFLQNRIYVCLEKLYHKYLEE